MRIVPEIQNVTLFDSNTGEELLKLDSTLLTATSTLTMTLPKKYEIDFDKINTIEDIKQVLKAMDIAVFDHSSEFDSLKHLLKEVE